MERFSFEDALEEVKRYTQADVRLVTFGFAEVGILFRPARHLVIATSEPNEIRSLLKVIERLPIVSPGERPSEGPLNQDERASSF